MGFCEHAAPDARRVGEDRVPPAVFVGEAMGFSFPSMKCASARRPALAAGALLALFLLTGCQVSQTIPTHRLIQHQAVIDLSGLKPTETIEAVKAHVAAPQ